MQPADLGLFLAKEITPLWTHAGLPAVHFTYMAILILCATLGLMALLSARTRAVTGQPDAAMVIAAADTAPDVAISGRGLWFDYRVQGAMLMGAVAVLLALLA
jgi:hypothetical protein